MASETTKLFTQLSHDDVCGVVTATGRKIELGAVCEIEETAGRRTAVVFSGGRRFTRKGTNHNTKFRVE